MLKLYVWDGIIRSISVWDGISGNIIEDVPVQLSIGMTAIGMTVMSVIDWKEEVHPCLIQVNCFL